MSSMGSRYQKLLRDNRVRSLLKAITYRISSLLITFVISLLVTQKLNFALAIGGFDALFKAVFYYLHERVWHYSSIGRTPPEDKK